MNKTIETLHLNTVLENHSRDLDGQIVAITGTTSGTGYVCAREVAKKGAEVILLNRKSERAIKSLEKLRSEVPNGKFHWIECDLQNFKSVHQALANIKKRYQVIDVLVNNAGVMAMKDIATTDGYDVQIQTNVLSHFLLTKELFPLMKNSSNARIVNHTSMARLGSPLNAKYFDAKGGDLGGDGNEEENSSFSGPRWSRYHQTKLANAVFTYSLQQKLNDAKITNIIPLLAHPGFAMTSLQLTTSEDGGMNLNSEFMSQAQSAEDGATGIIRAVMDPSAKSGDFFGPTSGWKGFPERLTPEDMLSEKSNVQINWLGCEKAVGTFVINK